MAKKLFLIHWNETEAEELSAMYDPYDWAVDFEFEDGARAGEAIKEIQPDVIVIYLSRLPSHGRETAHALKSIKATKHIRVIFVGGKDEAVEKTKAKVPDAIYVDEKGLEAALEKFKGEE